MIPWLQPRYPWLQSRYPGRETSLLFVCFLLAACASAPSKPDIPGSVSPGWKLSSLGKSAIPSGVPRDGAPDCWKANYTGPGSVETWICRYQANADAFDAAQRARAEAQTVKFHEGRDLVLVKWNNVSKADLTALIRALQKALQPAR